MDDELVHVLRRTIDTCQNREDLERRVIQAFGRPKLSQALLLAAEMKGLDWMRPNQRLEIVDTRPTPANSSAYVLGRVVGSIFSSASLFVLLAGSICLALVLMFPPFVVPFERGIVQNAGFAAIWKPPQYGNFYAVVNTPLLAVLVAGISMITAALYLLCVRIEKSLRGGRATV